MFRHGLRVSEACGLLLEQVDIESRILHVARLKGGLSTTHPLRGDEIRAIKELLVERSHLKAPGKELGRAFFLSEQLKPLHRSTVNLALRKCGEKARLPVTVHPHMLHPCLRLCSRRPGRGYPSDPGLSGAPQHSAHRPLHRYKPGTV